MVKPLTMSTVMSACKSAKLIAVVDVVVDDDDEDDDDDDGCCEGAGGGDVEGAVRLVVNSVVEN